MGRGVRARCSASGEAFCSLKTTVFEDFLYFAASDGRSEREPAQRIEFWRNRLSAGFSDRCRADRKLVVLRDQRSDAAGRDSRTELSKGGSVWHKKGHMGNAKYERSAIWRAVHKGRTEWRRRCELSGSLANRPCGETDANVFLEFCNRRSRDGETDRCWRNCFRRRGSWDGPMSIQVRGSTPLVRQRGEPTEGFEPR
jgi:hypothetical protein